MPDIGVRHESVPREKYAYTPLYLAIEILSDDTPENMFEKCRLYCEWGVLYCWVVDAEGRYIWELAPGMPPKQLSGERILSGLAKFIARERDFSRL